MRYAIVLTLLCMLAGNPVKGQGIDLGPMLGFQKSGDADAGKVMAGGAVRIRLSPALGVEGSIHYRSEKYYDGALTVKSWPVMATGLIYPLPIVYGAVGAGWYNTTFEYEPDRFPLAVKHTEQEFGWHLGGGVELPFGESTKLTGDIRYVFLNYELEDFPDRGISRSDFYVISVGILFSL